MTEMWLLLKCPERIIRADFCSPGDDPLQMSSREGLRALLPDFSSAPLAAPAHPSPPGGVCGCGGPSVKRLCREAGLSSWPRERGV